MKGTEKKEDESQHECKITVKEAEKLRKIISKSNSLWEIAVMAYSLGRHFAAPKD